MRNTEIIQAISRSAVLRAEWCFKVISGVYASVVTSTQALCSGVFRAPTDRAHFLRSWGIKRSTERWIPVPLPSMVVRTAEPSSDNWLAWTVLDHTSFHVLKGSVSYV